MENDKEEIPSLSLHASNHHLRIWKDVDSE